MLRTHEVREVRRPSFSRSCVLFLFISVVTDRTCVFATLQAKTVCASSEYHLQHSTWAKRPPESGTFVVDTRMRFVFFYIKERLGL